MIKKTKKHYPMIIIIIITALSVLAGCVGKDQLLDPKKPVTITVWHYYHGAQKSAFDDAVKEFNETTGYEKGIIVEAFSLGNVDELAANVMGAAKGELDAGNMPNIFASYGDTALEILNMGMLTEIDSYLTEQEISEYEESFIREGKIGTDKLYIFPIAKATDSLMLNKTDFDAFVEGLQFSDMSEETVSYEDLSTWEGLLRVSDLYYRYTESQATVEEQGGKAFFGLDYLANYMIVGSKQLGQDIVKVEKGRATIDLDEDVMSKLWYTYYEAMVTGRFTKLGRFCSDDIKTGDSLCFVGSTASASYFPTEIMLDNGEIKNIEMMALPMPVFEGGDKIAISQGAGMVIAKSDKEKEYASALFLKWFTETERNVPFSLSSSYLPVKKASLDDQLLNAAFEQIERDDTGTQNSIKALKAGIEQLRHYTLYSSDPFDGGTDFRSRLSDALSSAVGEDRTSFIQMTRNGLSPEQAYAVLSEQSYAKFDVWFNSLKE